MVQREYLVRRGRLETQAALDNQGHRGFLEVVLVTLGLKEQRDKRAVKANLVDLVIKALRVFWGTQANLDSRESWACLDTPAVRAHQEASERRAVKEYVVLKVGLVVLALWAVKVSEAIRVTSGI